MKKFLLLLLVIAGVSPLKAQQLTLKPTDTILFRSPRNFKWQDRKSGDSTLFKSFSILPKAEQLANMPGFDGNINGEVFYSRMPVAKLYSDDRMPVARLDGADKMPVKGLKLIAPPAKSNNGVSP